MMIIFEDGEHSREDEPLLVVVLPVHTPLLTPRVSPLREIEELSRDGGVR